MLCCSERAGSAWRIWAELKRLAGRPRSLSSARFVAMSTTPFLITHDFRPDTPSTVPLKLPIAPFNSGEWTLFSLKQDSTFARGLRWTGAVVPARLHRLEIQVMNVLAQSTNKEVTKLALVSQPASFPSQPSAEQCTVRCYFTGLYGMQLVERAQLQLIVTLDDDQSAPTTRAMASSVAGRFGLHQYFVAKADIVLLANSTPRRSTSQRRPLLLPALREGTLGQLGVSVGEVALL